VEVQRWTLKKNEVANDSALGQNNERENKRALVGSVTSGVAASVVLNERGEKNWRRGYFAGRVASNSINRTMG